MALLDVKNLCVGIKRGKTCLMAVKGLNLSINAGEITAIAGESGCGKTLSALSVMRLLPPSVEITGGTIQFTKRDGEVLNVNSISEKMMSKTRGKEIAMIFQEAKQALNPLMKIGRQIAETLELHGENKKTAMQAALDLLQKLQFPQPEKILHLWPHQLSGGMCQRVMIAVASICRPSLLIADEPTSSLDAENKNHILTLLRQINREFGTAVLFISHDLDTVRNFCSRILIMYSGSIIEEGPAQRIFSAPLHPYTKALLGIIPLKEQRGQPLAGIKGNAPLIEDVFAGCRFAPRCPKAKELCATKFPSITEIKAGNKVRCHYPEITNG
ncbi:MAG: ABC transporter ATP-binding protein [Treponema sp.]|nr:ABC transporter ATP-binding protein [Treponema sp.]